MGPWWLTIALTRRYWILALMASVLNIFMSSRSESVFPGMGV